MGRARDDLLHACGKVVGVCKEQRRFESIDDESRLCFAAGFGPDGPPRWSAGKPRRAMAFPLPSS
jgi:hypothetical protein